MEQLIDQIGLRQNRSKDRAALRKLEEILDVLVSTEAWLRRETTRSRSEPVLRVLDELRWTSAEVLMAASPEELDAGLLQLIHALLESPRASTLNESSKMGPGSDVDRSTR